MDFAGRPFKIEPKEIFPFAVTNSYAKNFSSLEKKMHNKIQNGAKGIISQPIFDIENAKKLLEKHHDNDGHNHEHSDDDGHNHGSTDKSTFQMFLPAIISFVLRHTFAWFL